MPVDANARVISLDGEEGCSAPRRIEGRAPSYPPNQMLQKVPGSAEVEFTVDADGAVIDLRVVSATHPKFGAYLADAVKRWRYEPARCADGARPARLIVRFDFRIGP